jgi:hypothetical protein
VSTRELVTNIGTLKCLIAVCKREHMSNQAKRE